jgi:hypothetical protein
MTIKEQITDLQGKTRQLRAENPMITGIWWEINDLPLAELQQLADEKKDDCTCLADIVERGGVTKFQLLLSGVNGDTIFCYSVPVVRVFPKLTEYVPVNTPESPAGDAL